MIAWRRFAGISVALSARYWSVVEYYRRGPWMVGTPIWVVSSDQEIEDRVAKMTCPHPAWTVRSQEVQKDPESGVSYFVVMEHCELCGAIRGRYIEEGEQRQPFDYSIPTKGPWYERLYNLGNFTVLARRHQPDPQVQPSFMTRIDTPSGASYTGTYSLSTLLFSPAVIELLESMKRMLISGPEAYAKGRILKEGRKSKDAKQEAIDDAQALGRVVAEIGPESIAAAETVMLPEPEYEATDMEEFEMDEMERQIKLRRSKLKRRPGS